MVWLDGDTSGQAEASFETAAPHARNTPSPQLAARPAPTIFDEDWWLDAAAPGAWDRVGVIWDSEAVGEMAFHVTRRSGLTYLKMPHLTRTMSPRLFPPAAKPAIQAISHQAIVAELLQKLPRHDRFERALNPGCPSVQGFVHANMAVTHMFTFRSARGDGPETMLGLAHQKTRRIIARAQRECEVERGMDLDRFIRLHRQAYSGKTFVDYAILRRLFDAAAARRRTEIIFVRLGPKTDAAAIILMWDSETTYYWLIARDTAQNYVGANSLLIFEAMCTAHRLGLVLDLDGYVRPEVGAFLMKFGLEPVVRPYVNGSSRLWLGLRAISTLLKPRRPDRHFRVP
jgi:Acetyltransferase (GNAT) domain